MTIDHSLGAGVYYSSDDYAGFMRRLAVLFVDTIALSLAGTMLWAVLAWFYLVPLKRPRIHSR